LVIMAAMNRHARSSFRRWVIAVGVAIPLITALVWMQSTERTMPTARIETPNGPIIVEIAATPAARAAGLSNRNEPLRVDGMLLKWEAAGRHPIWMAGMRFPLDLLWIDADGRVLAIAPNVPPCRAEPCTLVEPEGTASAVSVLELPAGGAAERQLAEGAIPEYGPIKGRSMPER
jgi:uncharacterized membrane protein (UPF0127 family)